MVTCGSSTGYWHEFDNRHLWMRVKRIIGSHGCTYHEAVQTNRLIALGMVTPTLSRTYPLEDGRAPCARSSSTSTSARSACGASSRSTGWASRTRGYGAGSARNGSVPSDARDMGSAGASRDLLLGLAGQASGAAWTRSPPT